MKILVDTHALIWWLQGKNLLSGTARALIEEPRTEKYASAVSTWEIVTKSRLGKLAFDLSHGVSLTKVFRSNGFLDLPLGLEHGEMAGNLVGPHKDPFDRMLAAQSLIEDMPLVTVDAVFGQFGVHCIW